MLDCGPWVIAVARQSEARGQPPYRGAPPPCAPVRPSPVDLRLRAWTTSIHGTDRATQHGTDRANTYHRVDTHPGVRLALAPSSWRLLRFETWRPCDLHGAGMRVRGCREKLQTRNPGPGCLRRFDRGGCCDLMSREGRYLVQKLDLQLRVMVGPTAEGYGAGLSAGSLWRAGGWRTCEGVLPCLAALRSRRETPLRCCPAVFPAVLPCGVALWCYPAVLLPGAVVSRDWQHLP